MVGCANDFGAKEKATMTYKGRGVGLVHLRETNRLKANVRTTCHCMPICKIPR